MFWLLLLGHFLADYPLQTDGMVRAKKRIAGLLMHVFIHFVTLFILLSTMTTLETNINLVLALSISSLHLGIDHWKNVLCRLRPTWVIFSYIQDQVLHLISLVVVCFIYKQYSQTEAFQIDKLMVFYTIGLILISHFWFVTERVLSNKDSIKIQWLNTVMWPRMMSRAMFYSVLYTTDLISGLVLCTGAVVVAWNDVEPEKRINTLSFDLGGTMILMSIIWFVGEQFFIS